MSERQSGGPAPAVLARDIGSWLAGIILMFIQSGIPGWFPPPEHPNDTLTWIAAILIGGPGVIGAWNVITSRLGAGPQSSVPPPSESPSSSSPT